MDIEKIWLEKYYHNVQWLCTTPRYFITERLSDNIIKYIADNNYKLINRKEFVSTTIIIADTYQNEKWELYIEYKK